MSDCAGEKCPYCAMTERTKELEASIEHWRERALWWSRKAVELALSAAIDPDYPSDDAEEAGP